MCGRLDGIAVWMGGCVDGMAVWLGGCVDEWLGLGEGPTCKLRATTYNIQAHAIQV